jgi:hypothetical protein
VVCLEREVQVFVCGCEVSLYCVCIYRCVHLKELTVCGPCAVTDAGMNSVISHCNQQPVLNLKGLTYIAGMCELCEDPEPTMGFIAVWCMIFFQQAHH